MFLSISPAHSIDIFRIYLTTNYSELSDPFCRCFLCLFQNDKPFNGWSMLVKGALRLFCGVKIIYVKCDENNVRVLVPLAMTAHGNPLISTVQKLNQVVLVSLTFIAVVLYQGTPEFYNQTKWHIGSRTSLPETFTIVSHKWDHRLKETSLVVCQ